MDKKLADIAGDMIKSSDGAFYLYEPEEYLALGTQDRQTVLDIVYEHIATCGVCGWHFHVDSLSEHEKADEPVCWRCYDDLEGE